MSPWAVFATGAFGRLLATFRKSGKTYSVLWPIFTSNALVYQCSERVDIQALAITGPPTTGAGVSTPICAAHINDTAQILILL